MKRSNVNVIIDNAINSQDYYRMYSSRDFYRGTSFKMAGAWTPDTHYFNDEHIIDFISCEGALLYCLRGHLSSEWNKPNLIYKDDIIVGVESNPYWAFIMGNSGKGQKGDKGDIGPIGPSGTDGITPQLKIEDGRWLLSMDKGQTWQDIGQATGDPGQNGTDGKNGSDGIGVIPGGTTGQALVKKSDADYDTEWKTISEGGEIPNFDAEVASVSSTTEANANVVLEGDIFKFSFGLPKGADGKDGENGKDGTNGVDGLPGIGIEVRYCLGTTTIYGGTSTPGTTRQPTGWNLTVPAPTEETPYVWFIQARVNYTNNTDKVGTIESSWSTPTKLSGTNGLNGENGSKGQIIYPEGIYNVNAVYQGTTDKTPYVYDSNDANYYVLNIVGTWQGTLHSNESPSTDTSNSWVKLDAFEALYTKIGIIANGLIGSAVFNGDYMFSQQGINSSGQVSTQYQNFNPETPTGGAFTPNILFNFKTGAGHMSAGKIKFDAEGNCELSNLSATNIQLSGNIVQEYEESDVSLDPTIHSLNAIIHADSISSVDFAISEEYDKLTLNKLYRGIVFNTGVDGPITVNFLGSNTVRIATSYGEGFNELYNVVIPGQAAMEYLFKPLSKTFISETGTNVYRGYVYILNPSQYTLSENSETAHTATLKVANNL